MIAITVEDFETKGKDYKRILNIMKGDVIVVEPYHRHAAKIIVQELIKEIKEKERRTIITVAGESGTGKSEVAQAIRDELEAHQIKTRIIGQDDYFVLPPHSNDTRRRKDPDWLGPQFEVKMDLLEQHITDAEQGKKAIVKPLIDYQENTITEERISLTDVKVIIVEGTYTSLLNPVDKRIFIDRTWEESLAHRKKRNRGEEVGDPFIEGVLTKEHKIIAEHKHLADILITNEYEIDFLSK